MGLLLRIAAAALIAVITAGGMVYAGAGALEHWSRRSITLAEPVIVEFPRGTTLGALSRKLAAAGVIERSFLFRLWVRLRSNYGRFQAGTYRFEGKISPRKIARRITQGKVYRPIVLQFTIPEGFTYKQLAARLIELGVGSAADYSALFADPALLRELNIPSSTIEGYLYPATYAFVAMPAPREALREPVLNFWRQLPPQYERSAAQLGLTLNQAVTFASLIELETPQASEKTRIAEVIWRRLRARMPLAIDAALIYGISDYRGNISQKHLDDRANLYNTRIHGGLPPTPIGSPARASLLAVLNPANEGNYYFVADPQSPGHHIFARSLSEHSKNVRNLVQAARRQRAAAAGGKNRQR